MSASRSSGAAVVGTALVTGVTGVIGVIGVIGMIGAVPADAQQAIPTALDARPVLVDVAATIGAPLALSAELTRADTGDPIVGHEIWFEVPGGAISGKAAYYCSANTDTAGIATCGSSPLNLAALNAITASGYDAFYYARPGYVGSASRGSVLRVDGEPVLRR